jgi:hypothetical protein
MTVWYRSYRYCQIPKRPFIIHYWNDFGISKKKRGEYVIIRARFRKLNDVKTWPGYLSLATREKNMVLQTRGETDHVYRKLQNKLGNE